MRINISPSGEATAVYSNKVDRLASALGTKHIQRATSIEFNNRTQQWEARLLNTGELLGFSPIRDDVVKLEIEYLNRNLAKVKHG